MTRTADPPARERCPVSHTPVRNTDYVTGNKAKCPNCSQTVGTLARNAGRSAYTVVFARHTRTKPA